MPHNHDRNGPLPPLPLVPPKTNLLPQPQVQSEGSNPPQISEAFISREQLGSSLEALLPSTYPGLHRASSESALDGGDADVSTGVSDSLSGQASHGDGGGASNGTKRLYKKSTWTKALLRRASRLSSDANTPTHDTSIPSRDDHQSLPISDAERDGDPSLKNLKVSKRAQSLSPHPIKTLSTEHSTPSFPSTLLNPDKKIFPQLTESRSYTSHPRRIPLGSALDTDIFVAEIQRTTQVDMSEIAKDLRNLNHDIERVCRELGRYAATVRQWSFPRTDDPNWNVPFATAEEFVFYGVLAIVTSYICKHFFKPFHPILDPEQNHQNIKMFNYLSAADMAASLGSELTELRTDLDQTNQIKAQLTTELQQAKSDLEVARHRLYDAEAINRRLKNELRQADEQIKSTTNALLNSQNELTQARESNLQLKEHLRHFGGDLENQGYRIQTLRTELGQSKASNEQLTGQIQQTKRELSEFKEFGILGLRGEEASSLCEYIQTRLDQKPVAKDATTLLRFLQDLCAYTKELPRSCWIEGVNHEWPPVNIGGEADIFRGVYNGRTVAIRSIRLIKGGDWESLDGKETIELIRREILMHRQLKHTNIIPLTGIFLADSLRGAPMIVLPFYQHGSAKDWLGKNMLSSNYLKILRNITDGLDYLHGRTPPMIHGDLHSGNVLIDDQGVAVLCDFGFARIRHEFSRILSKMQSTQNYRFIAPELIQSYLDEVPITSIRSTQESDRYSLGMTFYELGTHQIPFASIRSAERAAEEALKGARPPPPASLGGLKEGAAGFVWALITAMWHQDPHRRPSLEEVRNKLEGVKDDSASST